MEETHLHKPAPLCALLTEWGRMGRRMGRMMDRDGKQAGQKAGQKDRQKFRQKVGQKDSAECLTVLPWNFFTYLTGSLHY